MLVLFLQGQFPLSWGSFFFLLAEYFVPRVGLWQAFVWHRQQTICNAMTYLVSSALRIGMQSSLIGKVKTIITPCLFATTAQNSEALKPLGGKRGRKERDLNFICKVGMFELPVLEVTCLTDSLWRYKSSHTANTYHNTNAFRCRNNLAKRNHWFCYQLCYWPVLNEKICETNVGFIYVGTLTDEEIGRCEGLIYPLPVMRSNKRMAANAIESDMAMVAMKGDQIFTWSR